jgi:hypothetical protein
LEQEMTERERNITDAKWFMDRYSYVMFPLGECERPIKLADHVQGKPRICRFCGKRDDEVTFKSVAHAIPEFIGNRCMISMNECDECNQFFANNAEDHLSKASAPMRTMSQVRGKKGIPTHKAKGDVLRVEVDEKVSIEVRTSCDQRRWRLAA